MRNSVVSLLSAATLLLVPLAVPALASAQPDIQNSVCSGTGLDVNAAAGSTCQGTTSNGATGVNTLITNGLNVFSLIVGIVAVVMIIVGGFRYIMSGGDSGNISSAKTTIIYAIVGLILVAFAQFIVQFVLNKVTPGS